MSTATFSYISHTVCHGEVPGASNPRKKYIDWHRRTSSEVRNPRNETRRLSPGEVLTIFDGARALTLDGTSEFSLEPSSVAVGRYRLTWIAGTDPTFREARAVVLAGGTIEVVVLANSTATFTAGGGTPFDNVQVGDTVFIPSTASGDPASPFDYLNVGTWVVLNKISAISLQLVRPPDKSFEGVSETVTIEANSQFLVYSPDGIQVGDRLSITAGFLSTSRKTFSVLEVTSGWAEFASSSPLPLETGVTPGDGGISAYTSAKKFLRIETDQDCIVKVNGDTGSSQQVAPWVAGDIEGVGEYVRTGPTWSLVIENRAQVPANIGIISVE